MAKIPYRYIPSGFQLLREVPELGVQVYGNLTGKPTAIFYGGKRNKPDWYYVFKTIDSMDAKIDATINSIKQAKVSVAKRRAERAALTDVAIGDIFRCSWGYDQTNIDFYQVTAVKGHFVEVCEIAQMIENTGSMTGTCVPDVGNFIGKPMRKLIQNCSGEPCFRAYSFANAYRLKPAATVAGKPLYAASRWTAYA